MIVARVRGASACYLVDVAPFGRSDVEPYRALCAFLEACGFPTAELSRARTLEELTSLCGARYLTAGSHSLNEIPEGTVDVIWSHAVLEHVRRDDLPTLLSGLHRVLGPSGVCSHTVDLSDHMGGALNQLRFSEVFRESGFPLALDSLPIAFATRRCSRCSSVGASPPRSPEWRAGRACRRHAWRLACRTAR
jgi:SAM-dependent methyltransferase